MIAFLYRANGRFTRSQWWGAHVLIVLLALIGVVPIFAMGPSYHGSGHIWATIYNIWMVPTCVSLYFVANIKRYHDRGKSGWWWLSVFIPVVGTIWHLVECGFLAGEAGANVWGPPPSSSQKPTYVPAEELNRVRANLEEIIAKQNAAPKPTQTPLAGSKPKPAQYYDRPRDKQSLFSR
jgi:uncharacterized membrane protein YhaH (DUF805 family)